MELISLIVSIASLLIGFIGFIITVKTWQNTKDISKKVAAEKIKGIYPDKHPQFVQAINIASYSLSKGDRKYYIVSDLLKACRRMQSYYDNWESDYKREIDKFINKLQIIPQTDDNCIDMSTVAELQKELIMIQSMLERIGDLNGIG